MLDTGIAPVSLAEAISNLIALKSKRDNVKFTSYKLAKQIGVDRSLLQRLLTGQIHNPRLDTIIKVIDFFVKDGFPLSLEDVIQWKSGIVSVPEQPVMEDVQVNLSLYQMKHFGERIGNVTVSLPHHSLGRIAVLAEEDIGDFFKAGSVFIVDMMKRPEDNNMVMYRTEPNKIIPAKFLDSGNMVRLTPCEGKGEIKPVEISTDKAKDSIIGVVIRINVKA